MKLFTQIVQLVSMDGRIKSELIPRQTREGLGCDGLGGREDQEGHRCLRIHEAH